MAELPAVYAAVRDLVEELVGTLKRDQAPLPEDMVDPGFFCDDKGKWSLRSDASLGRWLGSWDAIKDNLYASEHARALLEALCVEGRATPPLIAGTRDLAEWRHACGVQGLLGWGAERLVQDYLSGLPRWEFDEERFDAVYGGFEEFLLATETPFITTVPISHFAADEDRITLGEGAEIVRLDGDAMAQLANSCNRGWLPRDSRSVELVSDAFGSGFAIRVVTAWPKAEPLASIVGAAAISAAITALRLVTAGCPRWNFVFTESKGFHPHWNATPAFAIEEPVRDKLFAPPAYDHDMHLTSKDAQAYADLWRKLRCLSDPQLSDLAVGLHKLNQLYTRESLEDRIIDIAVLFESTLLHGEADELKFRLRVRGAQLLGGTRCPRETDELLANLYDARSAIVHNGDVFCGPARSGKLIKYCKVRGAKVAPREFVFALEALCRDVLRTLVVRLAGGETLKDCLANLDSKAIGIEPTPGP